jgi:hypothetical protein
MVPDTEEIATTVINALVNYPVLRWILGILAAYELIGFAALGALETKYGDRHKAGDKLGFFTLLVWEFLDGTCFNVIKLGRNLIRWFLPAWMLKIVEAIGLLPSDVKLTPNPKDATAKSVLNPEQS